MHRVVHPHDGPGPMDRPRQSDSSAGHMEGHIVGIDCGLLSRDMRGGADNNNNNNIYRGIKIDLR